MNLYTPADGLFGTHVTWEDIEGDLQRELHTAAKFGANKTAKNIGDMKGFMSRMVLIDPDWQNINNDLPKKFVVKIISSLAMLELTEKLSKARNLPNHFSTEEMKKTIEVKQWKAHNVEVSVYNQLLKLPKGKMPMPKIYYMKKFSDVNPVKGYIIMEYVTDLHSVRVYDNVPPEAIIETLHALAAMEAMSLKFSSDEEKQFPRRFFTEFYKDFLAEDALHNIMKICRSFAAGKFAAKADKIEEILTALIDEQWLDQVPEELGMQRVLCHGDLWSSNMLWKQNNNSFDMVALIDFQTAHMGCPATDIARLFGTCLSGRYKQLHWEELLEQFYEYLLEEVGNGKMPFTLDQLKESYRRVLPMCTFLVLATVAAFFNELENCPEEDKKKKGMDILTEKVGCMMDDILYYHERNMLLGNENKKPRSCLEISKELNLYTPAGGLFDTHVTWEDIEKDLQREFHTSASFGPNKSAMNIGEGRGFMSKIVLIEPDWQHKDKYLPKQFVVKIISSLAMLQVFGVLSSDRNAPDAFKEMKKQIESNQKLAHNVEVNAYTHLLELPEEKVPIPKIYYMEKFSESNPVKGYIIMDFIDDLQLVHVYDNIPPKATIKILRALAAMQAMSMKFSAEEKRKFLPLPFANLFDELFGKEKQHSVVATCHSFAPALSEKIDKMEEILPAILDAEWLDQIPEKLKMQRVLCHGDMWSANMLWKRNGEERVDMVALIDFQTAHMGCPAFDLVRLFGTCLCGRYRQLHWEELLEEFYAYLVEEVAYGEMPYTFEQLKESYRRCLPMGLFFALFAMSFFFDEVLKCSEEDKRRKQIDILIEKMECALDDLIVYHKRNVKLREHSNVIFKKRRQ
ncbi:unnamed protein product [Cylicocyclus nassatus]|uniref:CHK kinase-like domain-containing protein n=1 Tax=Cylicocyclus nassatus TaxID=53992 RepID=A0AA36GEW9_CYLNA|nr:unnamed protein product [Cylicocyclus nassatus]